MKRISMLLFLIVTALLVFGQNTGKQKFYVGTFTTEGAKGIYLCEFDALTSEIGLNQTFPGIDNPNFLKISPNKKYLYVVNRAPQIIEPIGGYISAYEIEKNGALKFLNKQLSHGADPCHVDVSKDGKHVAVANYGGGTTSLYPVAVNGSLLPASSVIVNEGSGIDKSRQTKPYAHSIKFSPFENRVFSADLGTDQLNIFELEGDKLIQSGQKFVKLQPGSGPRHFDFHPDGNFIYVISELNSTITILKRVGKNWEEVQVISTLPTDFKGTSYCADVHVSNDGKYLYGSNRGHNSIAVFEINSETKKLKPLGYVPVEGDWPRNFSLSPSGDFMLVANQKSGNITVFKINKGNGMPEYTGNQIQIPAPVCIEFL
ncbi:MAG: lactonase family protein [Draconibacterium sp.]|nr:lactonase family protein [Draconibacterium sp.]